MLFLRSPIFAAIFVFVLAALASPAAAVITRLTPLKSIIDDSDQIVLATVEVIDPDRPSMTLTLTRELKGEATAKRWPILLKGSAEGDGQMVLARAKVGSAVILFITRQETQWLVNAYFEGTWIQIIGTDVEGNTRWAFTHGEPYLRRTFKDTTVAMTQAIDMYLKDGTAPPAVAASEKPGYGSRLDGTIETWSDSKTVSATEPAPVATSTPVNATPAPAVAPGSLSESLKPWLLIAAGIIVLLVLALFVRKKTRDL